MLFRSPKIRIPLKPELSPQANLRMYIKRYQKAKNGLEVIKQNIQKGHEELEQLKSAKARVEAGEDLDPAIGQDRQQKGQSKLSLLDKLLKIKVSDEFEIGFGNLGPGHRPDKAQACNNGIDQKKCRYRHWTYRDPRKHKNSSRQTRIVKIHSHQRV